MKTKLHVAYVEAQYIDKSMTVDQKFNERKLMYNRGEIMFFSLYSSQPFATPLETTS